MAISTERKTVLDAFKDWLEGITKANDYQTTVAEVKRGIHVADDMQNRPALCFWNDKGPRDVYVNTEMDRTLHVWLWGYINVQAGDYDNLDALVSDAEKRINAWRDNWPSNVINAWIQDSTYYEGGASDPVGMFEMEVFIKYRYTETAP